MLEILKFIFQDFPHWLGMLILLVAFMEGIKGIVKVSVGNKDKSKDKSKDKKKKGPLF